MDTLASLLGRNGYLPHGYCFTWTPGLLWTMVAADALIATAYFSIPLAIVSFMRRRRDLALGWLPWLFSAFIFACGLTHVMDVWTIWQPDYAAQALTKAVTAAASIVTAIALWQLIPKALRIPSIAQLRAAIASLEDEVRKRRSAEETLAEVQQSLALTLASIGAGFLATDREGRVTRMNAVAERVMGWAEADAQGRSLWDVYQREGLPPAYLQTSPIEVMLARKITVDQSHHVVIVSRGGDRTECEVKAALTFADDGAVRGMVLVFRDMTRELQAEAESRRLAAIVESSYDAIIGKTLQGVITSWNAAAQAMFGYSAEEAIGSPVQMLIPPDRADEEMRILTELAQGISVPAFDTVRLAKGGRAIELSVTISPIRDALGRIVGASKIARDVSVQHRAEAALRDSEARLRFTLEAAQIGDWDLDLRSGLARRSPRHDRCFGYDVFEGDWSADTFLGHVHPDDRAEVEAAFRAAVAGGGDWHSECRVVWADASVHWLSVRGSVLHGEAGVPTHMLGIVTEITQHRLAEETRLKALRLEAENRQIQAASELKSQFLANMSHELRTPLNAIIGFADLLYAGAVPATAPRHHDFLGHIASSGRHLLQLINDVLDLAKVESGKFEFFPEQVQLPQLVREVCDILHTAIQRKHIVVAIDIDAALTDLVLDPARLKQVLYNYLSNAIKFTPEQGRVTVRARAEGAAQFRLEVEDTGVGIAPADLPRLFIEFQQLDAGPGKQHQGTGLGLALTRRLVQAQGGSVGVRSTPGVGSVFHIVLARVRGSSVAVPSPVPSPMPIPIEAAAAPPRRVLVIHGEAHERSRHVGALGAAGYAVDAAATGAQARELAQQLAYDAITLDLVLPDQRGLGVLADIRGQGASRETPVVAVSMVADAELTASFAVADVLSKPIRSEEIVAAMAQLRSAQRPRPKVMVVDDDPRALDLMRAALAGIGVDAVCIADGRQALHEIEQHQPDAIILDLMMPGFDGFAVLDALQRLPAWRDTPVFIWTSMILTDEEYAALARSALAVMSKGGGASAAMLNSLRRFRPPAAVALLDGGA